MWKTTVIVPNFGLSLIHSETVVANSPRLLSRWCQRIVVLILAVFYLGNAAAPLLEAMSQTSCRMPCCRGKKLCCCKSKKSESNTPTLQSVPECMRQSPHSPVLSSAIVAFLAPAQAGHAISLAEELVPLLPRPPCSSRLSLPNLFQRPPPSFSPLFHS